jgi:hypothetical protein
MPRAPAFKISALADLHRQLQYAPPETRKRQLDAAERLINEIDPDIAYPSAFVIFRVTGYRPDDVDMVTFAGAATVVVLGVALSNRLTTKMSAGSMAPRSLPQQTSPLEWT